MPTPERIDLAAIKAAAEATLKDYARYRDYWAGVDVTTKLQPKTEVDSNALLALVAATEELSRAHALMESHDFDRWCAMCKALAPFASRPEAPHG